MTNPTHAWATWRISRTLDDASSTTLHHGPWLSRSPSCPPPSPSRPWTHTCRRCPCSEIRLGSIPRPASASSTAMVSSLSISSPSSSKEEVMNLPLSFRDVSPVWPPVAAVTCGGMLKCLCPGVLGLSAVLLRGEERALFVLLVDHLASLFQICRAALACACGCLAWVFPKKEAVQSDIAFILGLNQVAKSSGILSGQTPSNERHRQLLLGRFSLRLLNNPEV